MKRMLFAAAFALALLASPRTSMADTPQSDDSDHPLRWVAYVVHPIGYALDTFILQPIHDFVSGPEAGKWFGREPQSDSE